VIPNDPKARAAWTYNTASGSFDDPALSFWDRFGARTVDRLRLAPGSRVLDACCGTGASALPAAEAVGPSGSVLGVDLAEAMLERARAKAAARGLRQATFRVGDIEALGLPESSFDAVVCVFGIFFVDDMVGAVRSLWRLVRPGGVLGITTWGRGVFEPADRAFWAAVSREREDLARAFAPWDRANTPELLRALLADAGVSPSHVELEPARHPLPDPSAWWRIVMGSGYRATVEQLDPAARARIRETVENGLRAAGVSEVTADVVYGAARRDAV